MTTRRQFFKTSIAAAIALAIPALSNNENILLSSYSKMVRGGTNRLIGFGNIQVFKQYQCDALQRIFDKTFTPEFSNGKLNVSLHN